MLTSLNPHTKDLRTEITDRLSSGKRVYRVFESAEVLSSGVDLFLSDEHARQLAEAILSALYPVTAAMAESEGETVQ